jgi:hypothetical protein
MDALIVCGSVVAVAWAMTILVEILNGKEL